MLQHETVMGSPRRHPVHLDDERERIRLTPGALKAFFRIQEAWGLTGEQARKALGGMSNGRFGNLKQKIIRGEKDLPPLRMDELQRISYLIGITKALRILHSKKLADEWMILKNDNDLFRGIAPIDTVFREGIPALQRIRRLLDARRGMLS